MTAQHAQFSLEFESFRAFVDQYSVRLSERALFLPTRSPEPVGSTVEFSFSLSDEFRLLKGSGEVVWTLAEAAGGGSPGMAVRIAEADEPSQRLLERLVANHRKKGGEPFSLEPPPGAVTGAVEPSAAPPPVVAPPEAADPVIESPTIDLGQAIDLSSTVMITPIEVDSLPATSPPETETVEPTVAVEAEESLAAPVVEPELPEQGDAAGAEELLSIPDLPGAGFQAPGEDAEEAESMESSDPLGGFKQADESPFEEGFGALVPPIAVPDAATAASWLPGDEAKVAKPGRPWLKIALVLLVLAAMLFAVGVFMGDFVSGWRQGGPQIFSTRKSCSDAFGSPHGFCRSPFERRRQTD